MIKLHPLLKRQNGLKYLRCIQDNYKSTVPDVQTTTDVVSSKENVNIIKPRERPNLVAVAFAKLKSEDNDTIKKIVNKVQTPSSANFDERIDKAKNVGELLDIAGNCNIVPKQALRIISILGDWTSENKIKLSDFEKDVRFISMCRVLGSKPINNGMSDLATVLGVTGDDEAAKLISSISLPQMVKVLASLASKKRRSTPILRSLAFNITKSDEKLNIKQVADVLYSITVLNFPDEVLLAKICSDGNNALDDNARSSVAGSIATSLGMMKYRDTILLDHLSEWFVKNLDQCRVQDILSYIMTLALVNYLPSNSEQLFKVIGPILKPSELAAPAAYLDLVWSLVLLDRATSEHVSAVLSPQFVNKLTTNSPNKALTIATKLKLLNINGAAQLLIDKFKGPVLNVKKDIGSVPLTRTKEKQVLVNSVMETFSNLLSSPTVLQTDVDTTYGFLLDGECCIDNKCNPLPVNTDASNSIRVGIFILDYQDTCKGARYEPNGVSAFSQRLMVAKGYRILNIPYTEFNVKAKLIQRVQYLETKLKSLANS